MQDYFDSPYYQSAMYDSECGQIHPLNYCLGLAKEVLKNQNCKIYEESEVVSYKQEGKIKIQISKKFEVTADKMVLCCNAYLDNLNKELRRKIMPVKTYVSAYTDIPDQDLSNYFKRKITVGDMLFVLNYFRLDGNNNLIFGGGVSYSNIDPINLENSLKKVLKRYFRASRSLKHGVHGVVMLQLLQIDFLILAPSIEISILLKAILVMA